MGLCSEGSTIGSFPSHSHLGHWPQHTLKDRSRGAMSWLAAGTIPALWALTAAAAAVTTAEKLAKVEGQGAAIVLSVATYC